MSTYPYFIQDAFPLHDTSLSPQISRSITDSFSLTQTVDSRTHYQHIVDHLGINDHNVIGFGLLQFSLTDHLNLSQKTGVVSEYRIVDTLDFTQSVNRWYYLATYLNTLELTDSITFTHSRHNISVTSFLSITDRIFPNLLLPDFSVQGGPISRSLPRNPTITGDDYVGNTIKNNCSPSVHPTITLSGSGGSVTLRAPNLGNKDSFNVQRVNTRTRGGELILFGADFWSKDSVIEYDIEIFRKEDVAALKSFINDTLGLYITLTDHEGNDFNVIIITGNPEFSQKNNCDYTTSLSFQKFPR